MKVLGVGDSLFSNQPDEVLVSAVSRGCVGAPSCPDATHPVGAPNIVAAMQAIGDEVNAADAGERRVPGFGTAGDDLAEFGVQDQDRFEAGESSEGVFCGQDLAHLELIGVP